MQPKALRPVTDPTEARLMIRTELNVKTHEGIQHIAE
jgi:hypothetical protein